MEINTTIHNGETIKYCGKLRKTLNVIKFIDKYVKTNKSGEYDFIDKETGFSIKHKLI
jgi:hypothetical protein